MSKISIVYITARDNHPYIGLPEVELFDPLIESCKTQVFKDFELIVSDVRYSKRSDIFGDNCYKGEELPFKVKHVPAESQWIPRKMWAGQGTINSGLRHAEGELIALFADCSEFSPLLLQSFWGWYLQGYWAMAVTQYYEGGKPLRREQALKEQGKDDGLLGGIEKRRKVLLQLYGEGELVKDSRWKYAEESKGSLYFPTGQWFYAYCCVPLSVALEVNGFDENFDGSKPLGDTEFGMRCDLRGYYRRWVLDSKMVVTEHSHKKIPWDTIVQNRPDFKSNYALLLLMQKKRYWRGNCRSFTDDEIEWMVEEDRKWGDYDVDSDNFRFWRENPVIFDLREDRLEKIASYQ